MPGKVLTRKPRAGHKPYAPRQPKQKTVDAPKTSATKPTKHARSNLTLSDWLTVVEYFDNNQPLSQQDTVEYFAKRPKGALHFTQGTLSRHLSDDGCKEDQARAQLNPTALSGKRARIVTRPDVEHALVLWVKHMEEKGEHVTGAMLVTKREKFEEAMNVPDEERLKGGSWVQSFCKT